MSFPGTYMCNVSLCANDPVLRVLAELHIVVIREGMPADTVSKEVKELQILQDPNNPDSFSTGFNNRKDVENSLLYHCTSHCSSKFRPAINTTLWSNQQWMES